MKYKDPWITVTRPMSGTREKFPAMITFVKTKGDTVDFMSVRLLFRDGVTSEGRIFSK